MKTIKLDEKEYQLDVEKALAQGVLKRKVQHQIGNKYKNEFGGVFILSAINGNDGTFFPILIDVNNGYSYHSCGISLKQGNESISDEVFSAITCRNDNLFSLIP